MAQTGYTPIQLYYSSTTTNIPLAANMASGELAINITDGKLFYKDNGGVVQVIGTKGGTGSSSNTQVLFNSSGLVAGASGLTWDGSFLTASSIKDSALTSGRITFAGASGLLSDASTLTWDGTYLTANSIKDSALTSGRITFAGAAGLLSDSASLTWNGSTLAITGALTATTDSTFSSTGALTISKGTTGQQPGTPLTGMMRYNTTTNQFEGYSGASPAWKSIGGSALSNDVASSSNLYPVFASATTGTAENLYTSNAKYLYKPSTGELKVSAPVATNGIVVNADSVAADYTIATGTNGFSVGPVTLASGVTVTVASGQQWVVV